MDIRALQYFLAVAREESITAAAEQLHMTQPPLSRALKDLEDELGVRLLIRGTRKITLTEEGRLLRKRAGEIMDLLNKTKQEVTSPQENIVGDVRICASETDAMRRIAKAAQALWEKYPDIHYRLSSGDETDITEKLDKGLIDFGILYGRVDTAKYEYIPFPQREVWGVLTRRDSRLARMDAIPPEELWGEPLIISRQALRDGSLLGWMKQDISKLNIVSTYTLIYNASRMVDEGFGHALTVDKLINTAQSGLCFCPLVPRHEISIYFVWKKYQVFSRAAARFLEQMQAELTGTP